MSASKWIESKQLKRIAERVDEPLPLTISSETLHLLQLAISAYNGFSPCSMLCKAVGGIHARACKRQIKVFDSAESLNRELDTSISITAQRKVYVAECIVELPMGLAIAAESIKRGGNIDTHVKDFVVTEIKHFSTVEASMSVLFLSTIVCTGQDKNGSCYNALISLVSYPEKAVKVSSIISLIDAGRLSVLLTNVVTALSADASCALPNPRWAPGMLVLAGLALYRHNLEDINGLKKDINHLDINLQLNLLIDRYITNSYDERILDGVMTVFWALTKKSICTWHLPYLAVLSLFCKSSIIRKTARGILIEHLGHNPCPLALPIMDALSSRRPPYRKILRFFKVKQSLLRRYGVLCVSEETPKRIRLGVILLSKSTPTGSAIKWNINWSSLSSLVAATRIALLPGQEAIRMDLFALLTNPKYFSMPNPLSTEFLRLFLKLSCKVHVYSDMIETAVILSLKKNLYVRLAIKAILYWKKKRSDLGIRMETVLRKNMFSPACVFALCFITRFDNLNIPETSLTSTCKYVLAVRKVIPRNKAISFLLQDISSYETDRMLGDIGSYKRFDALFLLCHRYTNRKTLISSLSGSIRSMLPYSVLVPKLMKKTLCLTKKERVSVARSVLRMSVDKSRRISMFIFQSLLPSLYKLPYLFLSLHSLYERYAQYLPFEDAAILSVASILSQIEPNTNSNTKTRKNSNLSCNIKPFISGLICCFVFSDGCTAGKIEKYAGKILRSPHIRPTAFAELFFLSESSSKRIKERINEIKKNLM